MTATQAKMILLETLGFVCGERNTKYNKGIKGKYMVSDRHHFNDDEERGFCVVGDNLDDLIIEAYNIWEGSA